MKKIGRASLLGGRGSRRASWQGFAGAIALPISAGFEFFHNSRRGREPLVSDSSVILKTAVSHRGTEITEASEKEPHL
ncbi:MAG: hypothetical protein DMG05_21165 [Acidobacteria bacterium]|nr:MAG: hypothetical protein DMG05_21165 [Acidobacteriota bacterium]